MIQSHWRNSTFDDIEDRRHHSYKCALRKSCCFWRVNINWASNNCQKSYLPSFTENFCRQGGGKGFRGLSLWVFLCPREWISTYWMGKRLCNLAKFSYIVLTDGGFLWKGDCSFRLMILLHSNWLKYFTRESTSARHFLTCPAASPSLESHLAQCGLFVVYTFTPRPYISMWQIKEQLTLTREISAERRTG
jgi:hypothetical protein